MPIQISTSAVNPRRILVRGVNWLGDAVMTTPALQRLREHFPQTKIVLITHQKLADLWLHHPSVDEVITFTSNQGPWAVARRIRRVEPDLALVLPNSPRSAMEMWLARIPQRIGYDRPWRNWFLTRAVPTRPGHCHMRKLSTGEVKRRVRVSSTQSSFTFPETAHQIHEYLHLVAALGAKSEPVAPKLEVTDAEVQHADKLFRSALRAINADRSPDKSILPFGLNPSAEYGPAKRWPAEKFAAAVSDVSKRVPNCAWLLFGNDKLLCEKIRFLAQGACTLNFAGKTSLRALMASLKCCRVLLTNDSGPMHVAAALGTPVVVPFGSTSPALTGPGLPGDPGHALLTAGAPCSPCFRRSCPIDFRCMTGISVQSVVEAVLKTQMNESAGRSNSE